MLAAAAAMLGLLRQKVYQQMVETLLKYDTLWPYIEL
jgi:hypothetical protein